MNSTYAPEPANELAHEVKAKRIGRTRSGVEFDASGSRWSYRDNLIKISLNFSLFQNLSPPIYSSIRLVLLWYIENRSAGTAKATFDLLLHFSRAAASWKGSIDCIDATDLLNYRTSLEDHQAYYLGRLAVTIRRWHSLSHSGIDKGAIKLVNSLRIKGGPKGIAVLTMDLHTGPFRHIEIESIQRALDIAYEKNKLETPNYLLAWLYILLGQRNMQHAALKVCDVKVSQLETGGIKYSILIPRVKQGNVTPRHAFTERPLITQFGEILSIYADSVRRKFIKLIPDPNQAPLFPARELDGRGAPGFEYHQTATSLGTAITQALQSLSVFSERTGDQIHMMPTRFRRTIGTTAAEEGHGPLIIAQMLDHTDTQNVMVYSASTPSIIERIDRAIAMQMAPLAQAFAGVLVDGSNGPNRPSKRIIDLRIDRSGSSMGECGQHSFCGFNAPIACYTCKSFEAWLEGPHEAVLEHLLSERERLLKASDPRIASVNDRTLLAVAAVIQKCADIKQELKGKLNG